MSPPSVLSRTIASRLVVLLALSSAVPSHAQRAVVALELPTARRHEMTESLQIALSSRVDVELASSPGTHEPRESAPTYVLTVEFPSGQVAPGELVLRRDAAPAARARLMHAWDVVDPRAVGAVALSLVESSLSESPDAESVASSPGPDPVGVDEPERSALATAEASADPSPEDATANAEHGAEATPSPEPRGDSPEAERHDASDTDTDTDTDTDEAEPRLSCGLCSDFILQAGLSFTHGPASARGSRGELAFYARLNGWASVGLRFSGGGGYSSATQGFIDGVIGAPSVMVSHRVPFRRSGFGLELGVHAEAAIGLRFTGRNREDDAVSFGLGAGAFAAFELGRSHGLAIDYTLSTFGMGGRSVRNLGALSFLYTRRWGAR